MNREQRELRSPSEHGKGHDGAERNPIDEAIS